MLCRYMLPFFVPLFSPFSGYPLFFFLSPQHHHALPICLFFCREKLDYLPSRRDREREKLWKQKPTTKKNILSSLNLNTVKAFSGLSLLLLPHIFTSFSLFERRLYVIEVLDTTLAISKSIHKISFSYEMEINVSELKVCILSLWQ